MGKVDHFLRQMSSERLGCVPTPQSQGQEPWSTTGPGPRLGLGMAPPPALGGLISNPQSSWAKRTDGAQRTQRAQACLSCLWASGPRSVSPWRARSSQPSLLGLCMAHRRQVWLLHGLCAPSAARGLPPLQHPRAASSCLRVLRHSLPEWANGFISLHLSFLCQPLPRSLPT